jgi:metallo-beta-lactamase class B
MSGETLRHSAHAGLQIATVRASGAHDQKVAALRVTAHHHFRRSLDQMSKRLTGLVIGGGLFISACAPVTSAIPVSEARTQGAALAAACEGRDGWSDAAPPARIFGNTYYVGTCGISVLLITSPEGHVLIDGATAEAVPSILANIRSLGFDPADVKLIVGSHEHLDHLGGLAALKAATGANVVVREPARAVIETGRADAADPIAGMFPDMAPVPVARTVADGEVLTFGQLALTAVATPGHTSGGTSWTWRSCEGPNCATFAYVDSLTAVAADGYRFTDHPERVAPFRETFARVGRMPCDILVTPHPDFSNLFQRLSGTEPLIDRDACRRLVHAMRARFDARLASEAQP